MHTRCLLALASACCALTATAATAQALVSVHFVEKTSGQAVVQVPLTGGNYDVAVVLNSDEQVRGVAFAGLFVGASADELIHLSGRIAGAGSSGTGTRYNTPLWSASVDGAAWDPDLIAGPLGTTPVGVYGTEVLSETFFFHQSVMGWLNLTILPSTVGSSVSIAPTLFVWVNALGPRLENSGEILGGVRFDYVPEPGSAFLIAVGAALLCFGSTRTTATTIRGRRQTGWR